MVEYVSYEEVKEKEDENYKIRKNKLDRNEYVIIIMFFAQLIMVSYFLFFTNFSYETKAYFVFALFVLRTLDVVYYSYKIMYMKKLYEKTDEFLDYIKSKKGK